MRPVLTLLACLAAPMAWADGWTPTGDRAALEGRTVDYGNGAWQRFNASGATLYHAGEPSWGRWDMIDGRYCSQWPPAADWACYGLEVSADGSRVRFVDGRGRYTDGTVRP